MIGSKRLLKYLYSIEHNPKKFGEKIKSLLRYQPFTRSLIGIGVDSGGNYLLFKEYGKYFVEINPILNYLI